MLYIRKSNERGAEMDEKLLRELYKKYYRELYLYLYSLCKSKELAEDILQETFLKAILSLHYSHTNMRAWLYLVARNLYFNHSKKQKQQNNFDEISDVISEEALVSYFSDNSSHYIQCNWYGQMHSKSDNCTHHNSIL